jgi:hypothetical protein
MLRIPDHGLKINHRIEPMTRADPLVYRRAGGLCLCGIFGLAFARKKSSSEDLQMIAVRPRDELLKTADDLFRGHRLFGQTVADRMSDIIDALENN